MDETNNLITFRNVDLEIESREPIDKIIEDFGENVMVLYHRAEPKRHFASFEMAHTDGDAETIVGVFCTLIYGLEEEARQQWDACVTRNFDIGYESGEAPHSYQSILHHETIEAVAEIGGAIVITIYPVYKDPKPATPVDPLA
ncbi:MAG: hypothetical protein AB8C95_06285 [Phycisphaeraceae bacterium]